MDAGASDGLKEVGGGMETTREELGLAGGDG